VWASRELLFNLTQREVKGKYKRTIFGQLWSLVNPLALMLTYSLVFAFIIRVTPPKGDPSGLDVFPIWLLCALLPWTFFSSVLSAGVGSVVSNAGLVQKVYFSRIVLPLSTVTAYNWLFEMAVLLIALTVVGAFVLPWIPLIVVVMLLLAIFGAGLALLLSVANVHFRDTQNFVNILLPIWMYLTPIIYPISLVKEQSDRYGDLFLGLDILSIYQMNPMENFVELFRQLTYDNRFPDADLWLSCTIWAVVSFVVGVVVFQRSEKKLAELL
jgi:lipopolysaccharide transport system permease protein